jgi:signal peptidase I
MKKDPLSSGTERSSQTGKALVWALLTALLMKFLLFDFMITEGHSMMPAIKPGTILLVIRPAYGFRLPWSADYLLSWAAPKAGDVVVFFTPLGDRAVKRCAGLSGEDAFIALGDNSQGSFDSRIYGPVPLKNIIGRVLGVK